MTTHPKKFPRISFLVVVVALVAGFVVYQQTADISIVFASLAIVCFIVGLLFFEKKVEIVQPGKLSPQRELIIAEVWGGLFFLMGAWSTVNIFIKFPFWPVDLGIFIAIVITVRILITYSKE